jgi:hypothetical protein
MTLMTWWEIKHNSVAFGMAQNVIHKACMNVTAWVGLFKTKSHAISSLSPCSTCPRF